MNSFVFAVMHIAEPTTKVLFLASHFPGEVL
jgi:hypothetical protein